MYCSPEKIKNARAIVPKQTESPQHEPVATRQRRPLALRIERDPDEDRQGVEQAQRKQRHRVNRRRTVRQLGQKSPSRKTRPRPTGQTRIPSDSLNLPKSRRPRADTFRIPSQTKSGAGRDGGTEITVRTHSLRLQSLRSTRSHSIRICPERMMTHRKNRVTIAILASHHSS